MLDPSEVDDLNRQLATSSPKQVIVELITRLPRVALAFSGAEDVLLYHLASKLPERPECFSIDTGRLHGETMRYIDRLQDRYKYPVTLLQPDEKELEEFIKNRGLNSFYENGHEECCAIRKVAPLRRYLTHYDAWITGQRQDQSPTRREIPVIEVDNSFSTSEHQVLKINPLAKQSSAQVWQQIRLLEIPYNPLHDRGFVSIGCEPCTRAIGPGQHEREGRWWWEEATIKECGLHRGNLDPQD